MNPAVVTNPDVDAVLATKIAALSSVIILDIDKTGADELFITIGGGFVDELYAP